jgi:hypothetical protein
LFQRPHALVLVLAMLALVLALAVLNEPLVPAPALGSALLAVVSADCKGWLLATHTEHQQ